MNYEDFLDRRSQIVNHGFEPLWIPDWLFGFQKTLVDWSIRKGKASIFADCGLGKTPMQLVWAENVVRKTKKPVLILTPLSVSQQTVQEANKFGITAKQSQNGKVTETITVTNYERLNKFKTSDFAGVVADESSILKSVSGVRRTEIIEFMRTVPYRLLCTATAAPNDYDELGNSSEALGELGYQDMITRFFTQKVHKDYLGWGRTAYRLRGHAEEPFWRWVCSWARSCRKPSDLGGNDAPFVLPPLDIRHHNVKSSKPPDGHFFAVPALTLEEQRREQRQTIKERCRKVADLVGSHKEPALVWCNLNDEGDLCEKMIPGARQVSGKDTDEEKERKFNDFVNGKIRVLVSKSRIAGYGLNFQHCAHQTFFISHSFESWYQSVRRSWRFGQKRPVVVDMILTEGTMPILTNLRRKQVAVEKMFSKLVDLMSRFQKVERSKYGDKTEELPAWLSSNKR